MQDIISHMANVLRIFKNCKEKNKSKKNKSKYTSQINAKKYKIISNTHFEKKIYFYCEHLNRLLSFKLFIDTTFLYSN